MKKKDNTNPAANPQSESPEQAARPLGHGDHWQALGVEEDAFAGLLEKLISRMDKSLAFDSPWPDDRFRKLVRSDIRDGALTHAVLYGLDEDKHALVLVSAYPVYPKTTEWVVRVDEVTDAYGAFEGLVRAKAPSGHGLVFFAPDFGLEAGRWQPGGLTRVALSGIALKLEIYPAEPIILREGPLVEEAKAELRAKGQHKEADDPDFHFTVETNRMRTLYSLFEDHAQIIGKVMSVSAVKTTMGFEGWRMGIECMPDKATSGHRLPVFVSSSVWNEPVPPAKGNLVVGVVWLNGVWVQGDAGENEGIWNASGGD